MISRRIGPALALLGAACSGEQPAPPPAPPAAPAVAPAAPVAGESQLFLRGTLSLAPELSFRACEGGPLLIPLDSTGGRLVGAARTSRSDDTEGMYILARATEGGGRTVLRDLEYGARPGPADGCEQPAPEYLIMARGTGPGWRVTISDAVVQFSDSASPDGIQFVVAAPDDSAEWQRYRFQPSGSHTLELLLTRSGCSENGTGAYGSMRAMALIDGRSLTGCGWRGRLP